jgi:hypothetical protein
MQIGQVKPSTFLIEEFAAFFWLLILFFKFCNINSSGEISGCLMIGAYSCWIGSLRPFSVLSGDGFRLLSSRAFSPPNEN